MRRILFVIESLAEALLLGQFDLLLGQLVKANFDVQLVSLGDDTSNDHHPLNCSELYSVGPARFELEKILRLRKLTERLNPEIIHSWGASCHTATHASSLGIKTRRVFSHFERSFGQNNFQTLLQSFLGSSSDVHIYSHDSLLDSRLKSNQSVVPNAIHSTAQNRAQKREQLLQRLGLGHKNVFLVATVSRLQPRYRVKDLVWAMDLLCCVRRDIHLAVFGKGDWGPLNTYLEKTEASGNVHFLDLLPSSFDDLQGIDFYWNAQREQPNPSAMLNCMACQIPVISVLDKETRDLILPMQTALATNFGARDEFARWTKYLIEQPESGQRLARQAKAHVEKLFTTDKMVNNYMSIYNEG